MAYHDALHAARVLVGLRTRRLLNLFGGVKLGRGVARKPQQNHSRAGNANATRIGWLLVLCFAVLVGRNLINTTRTFLLTLYCEGNPICDDAPSVLIHRIAASAHLTPFSPLMTSGMTMLTVTVWLFSVLYPFVLAMQSGPTWDLEWLATLPMTRTTLLCTRILERAIVNPIAWFMFSIVGAVTAWYANTGWLTPLYVFAVIAPLILFVAAIWTVLDLGLHILLAPAALRNFQALLLLLIGPIVYLLSWIQTPTTRHLTVVLAAHTPAWLMWSPPALAIRILAAPFQPSAFALYGGLLCEVALVVVLSVLYLRFQLRAGIVMHGARESGRSASKGRKSLGRADSRRMGFAWLSPVKRRELTLFLRDRRHLIQCTAIPLMMLAGQFVTNAHTGASLARNPSFAAGVAFFVGAYTFTQTAMLAVVLEGERLWLLYTFPRSPGRVLLEKAQFYCGVTLLYALVIFASCMRWSPLAPWHFATSFLLVVLGLPMYAVIALSLGVLSGASSPTGTRRIGARHGYLFMSLAGIYVYALVSQTGWQQVTTVILCALLAFGFWQKANDRLPYLLDPAAAPSPRVSLADGQIAALLFFVLQFIAGDLLKNRLHVDASTHILVNYICAGGVTYLLMRVAFWSMKTRGLPQLLGDRPLPAVVQGAAIGALCGVAGLFYLWVTRRYGLAPTAASASSTLTPLARVAVCALTVGAAPIFEEFVFRGLVFNGMRRSLNLMMSALGSAALFAIVHPPYSMLPVFILGLGTAWVYERRKMLLASMATHAVYNAIVVGYQLVALYN